VNSADAWYEGDEETRYADRDLTPLLDLSVELAKAMNEAQREIEMNAEAIKRHPSGKVVIPAVGPGSVPEGIPLAVLNAADRCDAACPAAALYRMRHTVGGHEIDLCHHHRQKHAPRMSAWSVVGVNPKLMDELYANRLKGADHA
jgi:hypothetical protein